MIIPRLQTHGNLDRTSTRTEWAECARYTMAKIKSLKSTMVFRKRYIAGEFAIQQNTDILIIYRYGAIRYRRISSALFDMSFISIFSIRYLPHILSQGLDIFRYDIANCLLISVKSEETASFLRPRTSSTKSPVTIGSSHRSGLDLGKDCCPLLNRN
ncbi:hypothetical protein RvY_02931 [Ramazzottius varieornatus]|uniref:Uncharacterized protein n=1 Tax=Ramazzottius varieornatus TaxID=947166 RepID=A0A1D1UQ56_RAMVA|nr:hypothetical protein RvY_02931 [Ramazzottius varieornatus]